MNRPFVNLEQYTIDENIVNMIPKAIAKRNQILAIDQMSNIVNIVVGNEEYHNFSKLKKLKERLSKKLNKLIFFIFADEQYIREGIEKYYA